MSYDIQGKLKSSLQSITFEAVQSYENSIFQEDIDDTVGKFEELISNVEDSKNEYAKIFKDKYGISQESANELASEVVVKMSQAILEESDNFKATLLEDAQEYLKVNINLSEDDELMEHIITEAGIKENADKLRRELMNQLQARVENGN